MAGQRSQEHLASARCHLKKKIIIIHLPSVSAVAILVFLASTAPFQVLLGRIPLKTIPPVSDSPHWFRYSVGTSDQTIRSERADLPHHRCYHSCESLQPSLEERGCEHAEKVRERIKCDYFLIYLETWQRCSREVQLLHIGPCWIIFQRKMITISRNRIWNLQRGERQKTRRDIWWHIWELEGNASVLGALWNYS